MSASIKLRLFFALGLGAVAGCTTPVAPPAPVISPEKSAADFSARSLRDASLHRFVQENLGRDPGEPWDFEALSWAAFYYHPSLEVARAQWASARSAREVAGLRPNPTLTLTPGYNFTREPGLSPWLPAINFDFLFATAGKRARQMTAAESEAEVARLGVFTAAWQVRSDLRRALIDAAIATRRGAQLHTQAEKQRELLGLLEQRFAAGGIAATEVSLARTSLFRAEAAAADAQGQALVARSRVAASLGVPVVALEGVVLPLPQSESLSPAALTQAREEALRSRPDVLVALAKYHSAHATVEWEVAKQVPDFHLGPGYQWDQGGNKWTLAVSFELPIFHRNEAAIAAVVARRAEAAAQFNLVQAEAIAGIDQASAAAQAAQLQRERAGQLQAEMRAQAGRVTQRVEAGAADQLELQTARLEIVAAETAVLDAENAAAVAAGQLEDALQRPLPGLDRLARPSTSSARTHE